MVIAERPTLGNFQEVKKKCGAHTEERKLRIKQKNHKGGEEHDEFWNVGKRVLHEFWDWDVADCFPLGYLN